MSSKYHWTQELTNPQDRFRLYQQVMSLSTNTTIPILAEVGQYKSWSETLVRIACESSRYWNYFLQAGSYHPSAITDPDELEILTTLDNTFTELIKHSVSEEIREEINEYLTLNVAKRSTSFDIMDYLKIRFDHESAAIHYHNNFGWMDELPQLPFRKKYFLIQKFMEFLEEGLVGKAGEPLKTIEERKQFINETTANLLLIQAPKERDLVLNERKFQPHLVPAEVLHIVTGSGVSVPSTYHDGYATTVTQHQNSFQKQFKPKNPRKPTCGHCGKPHKLSQCIDYYQTNPNADIFKRFGHPGQEPQIPRSYCAYLDSDQPTPNAWIWDTGATNHMCGDKQYFINYFKLDSFKRLNVYTLVELPPGRRALGVRWVFTLKDSGLKKARLVAQGFRQKEGIDYQETFAPVIRYDSVRIFLSVSAHLNLRVHQMDVNTAFLNSRMTDTVYVKQPPGFLDPLQPNAVWKLSGGMYGLKQSPLLWNNHINSSLIKFGFSRHQSEYGLYYKQTSDGLILVALYVDDLLLAAPTPKLMNITKSQLSKAYSMKDLGPVSKFLGMNVSQSQNGNIFLSLEDYIVKAASISEVPTHKRVHTPLSSSTDYFNDKSPLLDSPTAYQSLVGQLLFVANTGRPDIAYPISVLSRFLKAPRQVHLIAAQRIMQYLYTTRKHGLSYKSDRPLNLAIYSDASYGSATDLPMSTGGYITFLADGIVSWKSNKIKSVCQSSTEAEYVAASDALREMAWISNLCDEIKKPLKDKVLYVDNQPAIRIAENPVLHDKIKHIQVKYHYIRQQVAEKNVRIQYVPTKSQLADIMTKIIPRTQYEVLRNSILTSA